MGVESIDPGVTGKRAAKRARVLLAAKLHGPDGSVDARLRDLSRKGALVECKTLPAAGTALVFERGETRLNATVAWAANGRVGLEFERPIQESELYVHIGRPASRKDGLASPYDRAAMQGSPYDRAAMQGMTARDRKFAKAWSVAVGLNLPES